MARSGTALSPPRRTHRVVAIALAVLALVVAYLSFSTEDEPRRGDTGDGRPRNGRRVDSLPVVVATAASTEKDRAPVVSSGRERSINVRVLAEDGAPIAGAHVIAVPAELNPRRTLGEATSGSDGVAQLSVSARPAVVVGRAAGFLPAEAELGNTSSITLTLRKGRSLAGKLVRLDGTPAAGAVVASVGIGYGRRAMRGGAYRAHAGSGFARAETDSSGRFVLEGVGDERVMLYLEGGWRFVKQNADSGPVRWNTLRPIVRPGQSERTFVVWQTAFVAVHVVDADTSSEVARSFKFVHVTTRAAELDFIQGGPEIDRALGLGTAHFGTHVYQGRGLYLWAVKLRGEVPKTLPLRLQLDGYEAFDVDAGVVTNRDQLGSSTVPTVRAKRVAGTRMGQVDLQLDPSFPSDRFPSIPFGATRADGSHEGGVAERRGSSVYRATLRVGDYKWLVIGRTTLYRSDRFSITESGGGLLTLSREDTRSLQLLVAVQDRKGRPIHECGITVYQDIGERALRGIGDVECGAGPERWPREVVIRRAFLGANAMQDVILKIYRPGYETKAVNAVIDRERRVQRLSVILRAVGEVQ